MVQMLGGQAVVQTLLSLGARSGFGVPGESYLAVLDAFYDAPDFRFIGCRNEGGAAFMAEAWAKLTGGGGPVFCYPWPWRHQCQHRGAYGHAGLNAGTALRRAGWT